MVIRRNENCEIIFDKYFSKNAPKGAFFLYNLNIKKPQNFFWGQTQMMKFTLTSVELYKGKSIKFCNCYTITTWFYNIFSFNIQKFLLNSVLENLLSFQSQNGLNFLFCPLSQRYKRWVLFLDCKIELNHLTADFLFRGKFFL